MPKRKKSNPLIKLKLTLLGIVLAALGFLAFVTIEAPTQTIVTEIPLELED